MENAHLSEPYGHSGSPEPHHCLHVNSRTFALKAAWRRELPNGSQIGVGSLAATESQKLFYHNCGELRASALI